MKLHIKNRKNSFIKELSGIIPVIIRKKVDIDIGMIDIKVSNDLKYVTIYVCKKENEIGMKYSYIINLLRNNIYSYVKMKFVPTIIIQSISIENYMSKINNDSFFN